MARFLGPVCPSWGRGPFYGLRMTAVGAWPVTWARMVAVGAWIVFIVQYNRRGNVTRPLDPVWPP